MRTVIKWESAGRDQISLEEILKMHQDGYEFVIHAGHVEAIILNQ